MNKHFVSSCVGLLLLASPMFAFAYSNESVISDLKAQIQVLLAQLMQLQERLKAAQPVQASCHTFDFDLTRGDVTTEGGFEDTRYLQQFLAKEGYPVDPAETDTLFNGRPGSSFGISTYAAVVKFQNKYGIRQTGYVGTITRNILNSLYGCPGPGFAGGSYIGASSQCQSMGCLPGVQQGPDNASVSVLGMNKYIEPDFGFSFWYPTSWKVSVEAVARPDAFPGGSLSKALRVSDGKKYAYIQEFYSPTRSITLPYLGMAMAGYNNFYFDVDRHQWMTATVDGTDPSGPAKAADVSKNTMGGLHMFYTTQGFGSVDIIVPLSARNFLIITGSMGPGSDRYAPEALDAEFLARTIVATDPAVATPVSVAEQNSTIQAERAVYSK